MLQLAHQLRTFSQLAPCLWGGMLATGMVLMLQAAPAQANEIVVNGGVTIRFGRTSQPVRGHFPGASSFTYQQFAHPTAPRLTPAPQITIVQPTHAGGVTRQVFRGQIEGATLVNPIIVNSSIENSTLINPVIVEAPRSTRRRVVIHSHTPHSHFSHTSYSHPFGHSTATETTCVVISNFRLGC